jgi:hypothetical protein
LLVSLALGQEPLVATGPFQPPLAKQWVALAVFHDKVVVPGLFTVVGEAVSVMLGTFPLVTMTSRDSV